MISHPVLVGLAVAVAIVLSAELSRRTRVPEPCYLVLAGLAVSAVPGIAAVRLPPDVVFYGFLPPLLYSAAFLTAPREVRENWLSILLLAVGLTTATMFAVAGAAWGAVAVLGAGTSFLLGTVLGPTDPVSASGVIGSTSAPEKLRTILEGESLVNDGVALVAFSIALTAVEKGNFSVGNGPSIWVGARRESFVRRCACSPSSSGTSSPSSSARSCSSCSVPSSGMCCEVSGATRRGLSPAMLC